MRGIFSIASAVAPVAAIAARPSGSPNGFRKPTSVVAAASFATSSGDGGATLTITRAPRVAERRPAAS